VILILVLDSIFTSLVLNPTHEKSKVSQFFGMEMVYFPSMSVITSTVVPLTRIVAPGIGRLSLYDFT